MYNNRLEISREEAIDMIDNKFKYFKNYIKSFKNLYYVDYNQSEKEIRFDEVEIGDRQFLIIVNMTTNQIYFRDDLTDYYQLYEADKIAIDRIDKFKEKSELLEKQIKDVGYLLCDSGCGGQDYYLWYDLVINLKEFDENKFLQCVKLWDSYNDELNKLI